MGERFLDPVAGLTYPVVVIRSRKQEVVTALAAGHDCDGASKQADVARAALVAQAQVVNGAPPRIQTRAYGRTGGVG